MSSEFMRSHGQAFAWQVVFAVACNPVVPEHQLESGAGTGLRTGGLKGGNPCHQGTSHRIEDGEAAPILTPQAARMACHHAAARVPPASPHPVGVSTFSVLPLASGSSHGRNTGRKDNLRFLEPT